MKFNLLALSCVFSLPAVIQGQGWSEECSEQANNVLLNTDPCEAMIYAISFYDEEACLSDGTFNPEVAERFGKGVLAIPECATLMSNIPECNSDADKNGTNELLEFFKSVLSSSSYTCSRDEVTCTELCNSTLSVVHNEVTTPTTSPTVSPTTPSPTSVNVTTVPPAVNETLAPSKAPTSHAPTFSPTLRPTFPDIFNFTIPPGEPGTSGGSTIASSSMLQVLSGGFVLMALLRGE